MPTLLKACGVEAPAGLPGIDLFDEAAVKARDAVFGACFDHDMIDFDAPAKSLKYRWCREGNWKLILPAPRVPDARPELYDLAADPRETRDLAGMEAERLAAMTRRIGAWWAAD